MTTLPEYPAFVAAMREPFATVADPFTGEVRDQASDLRETARRQKEDQYIDVLTDLYRIVAPHLPSEAFTDFLGALATIGRLSEVELALYPRIEEVARGL